MAASLLNSFELLDKTTKDILADIDSPRLLAFLTLYIAKKQFGVDTLSAEHIIACLESAGVAATKTSIGRSLSKAKGFVTRKMDENREVFYKLMITGEREAEKQLGNGKLVVLKIESEQPRQARLKLAEIFKSMDGVIRICDPYYGEGTFDSLDLLPKKCDVRFLTQRTNETQLKIDGLLRSFYRERPKTELRLVPTSSRLHDRYIVTKQQILILGHGIKDIGSKESFIIVLDKNLVPDIINEITTSFDNEWAISTKI